VSTNTEIVSDALRTLKVLAEGATPTAEQASDALRRLNQMLATWEVDSIVLGYHAQTDPSATCPIPDWAEKGVAGMLAVELAPEYAATLSLEAAKAVGDGYEVILRRVISLGMKGADMSHLGASGARYNILTDTF